MSVDSALELDGEDWEDISARVLEGMEPIEERFNRCRDMLVERAAVSQQRYDTDHDTNRPRSEVLRRQIVEAEEEEEMENIEKELEHRRRIGRPSSD